jgi:hypothetical protein
MAIAKTLFGITRNIPQIRETGWGNEVTNLLADVVTALEGAFTLLNQIPLRSLTAATSTLAAGATLTQAADLHQVAGSGGPVTLSASAAIAAGTRNGQILMLQGTSDANTVTINDAAGVDLNGPITLGNGHILNLVWNSTRALWVEISRNN